ncbi:MAG: tetratricopeptide repeat protein [Candidatus Zixiibacteriota bacterium]
MFYTKILLLLFIITLGISDLSLAQNDKTCFEFLRAKYNDHDSRLSEYLKTEVNSFISQYPQSSLMPDALILQAKIFDEFREEEVAVAILVKVMFLYPTSDKRPEANDLMMSLIAGNDKLQEIKNELFNLSDKIDFEENRADRYYSYLEFIYDLGQPQMYNWLMGELYHFLAEFPDHIQIDRVHRWIAGTYGAENEEQAAVAAYLKYEMLFPESEFIPLVKNRRAEVIYEDLKEYDTAMAIFTNVIEQYPSTQYVATALFHRAKIKANRFKEYVAAINDLRRLADDFPDHQLAMPALFEIARLNEKKQKAYIGAIGVYEEIVEKYPNNPQAPDALIMAAKLHTKINEDRNAIGKYAQYATHYPNRKDSPQMLFKAGMICESKLKDNQQAFEYFDAVAKRYPDSKYAPKAQKKADRLRERLSMGQ